VRALLLTRSSMVHVPINSVSSTLTEEQGEAARLFCYGIYIINRIRRCKTLREVNYYRAQVLDTGGKW